MEVEWILIAIAPILLVILWLMRKKLSATKANGEQSLGGLAEVIKSAEVANDGFFRALELVQKNLESLIARAEGMEHRLQSLMLHPGVDKREQYTAAALLLAEGHEPERVASMLNLPTAQVQLIRDLQQVTAREKRMPPQARNEESFSKEMTRPSKPAAVQEKTAARPILLVDMIKSAANETVVSDGQLSRLDGATV
jgi:hypothetical protein